MPLLTSEDLNQIRKHKYLREGISLLEPFYDPVWNKVVSCLPRYLSPNIVTLAGLLSAYLPCLIVLYYSHHGDIQTVGFASFFCSVGFQLWMNLDSLDGKLARQNRPKKYSPFGELLDHGGDALAVLIVLSALGCITGLNTSPVLFIAFVFAGVITNFISEPWSIYITGVMKFQSVDFIEITILMSSISLISGIYGVEIWQTVIVERLNFQLRHIVFSIQMSIIPDMIFGKIPVLLTAKKEKGWRLLDMMSPAIPLAIIILSICTSCYCCTAELLQKDLTLFVIFFGIGLEKLHLKFIVTHMINAKFTPYDRCLVLPVLFTIGITFIRSAEMQRMFLYGLAIGAILDAAWYSYQIFYQLYIEFNDRIFFLESTSHDAKVQSNGETKH